MCVVLVLDLCQVTFKLCPDAHAHTYHAAPPVRCEEPVFYPYWFIWTSVSLLGATRVHLVQNLLNQRLSYHCYYTGMCPLSKVVQIGAHIEITIHLHYTTSCLFV